MRGCLDTCWGTGRSANRINENCFRQAAHLRSYVVNVGDVNVMNGQAGGPHRLDIGKTVFLIAHDHKIWFEGNDRVDVGILRSSNRGESLSLLAESSDGDGLHLPRQKRFGRTRHKADDTHASYRYI